MVTKEQAAAVASSIMLQLERLGKVPDDERNKLIGSIVYEALHSDVAPYHITLSTSEEFTAAIHLYRQWAGRVAFLLSGIRTVLKNFAYGAFTDQIDDVVSWTPKRIEEAAKATLAARLNQPADNTLTLTINGLRGSGKTALAIALVRFLTRRGQVVGYRGCSKAHEQSVQDILAGDDDPPLSESRTVLIIDRDCTE